jgi:DNA-binding transcriptional LysR family regulator
MIEYSSQNALKKAKLIEQNSMKPRVSAEIESGALEIVMSKWASDGPPFTIYYPSRRQTPPGLRQLIDAIRQAENLPRLAARSE